MKSEELISAIRGAADRLKFESPTRGAVVLARLRYGLPASEAFPDLPDIERVMAAVRRTIQHSHSARAIPDQWGNGTTVLFGRHVTEGDERWDFEVEVTVDKEMNAVISDGQVVRPGDADLDEDDEGREDEGEAAGKAKEARPPLTIAELLPFGMIACPCCGHATLSQRERYQICPVCFWEDDGQDSADADQERGGPNRVSLRQGRVNYLGFGASVDADRDKVRRPTAEEVQLRRFGEDGREIEG